MYQVLKDVSDALQRGHFEGVRRRRRHRSSQHEQEKHDPPNASHGATRQEQHDPSEHVKVTF